MFRKFDIEVDFKFFNFKKNSLFPMHTENENRRSAEKLSEESGY